MDKINLEHEERLNIRLYLSGNNGISGSQLINIIQTIEKTCFLHELDGVLATLPLELPEVEKKSLEVIKAWEQDRPPILLIKSATTGSIIFEGVIVAATTWVLLNTVGETFKEAWKESQLHQDLKRAFLYGRREHSKELSESIKEELVELKRSNQRIIESLDVELNENGSQININIRVVDKVDLLDRLELPEEKVDELIKGLKKA